MGKQVCFSQSYTRTCYHWVPKQAVSLCTTCQQWGHHASKCHTNWMICSKCAGTHPTCNHDLYCDQCKTGNGHTCQPKCANCDGDHSSTNSACPFWKQCFNYEGIQEPLRKRRDDRIAAKDGKAPVPWRKAPKPTGACLSNKAKGKQPEDNTRSGSSSVGLTKPFPPNPLAGAILPPKPASFRPFVTFAQMIKATEEAQSGGSQISEITDDDDKTPGVETSMHAPQPDSSAGVRIEYCSE
jgi:hypothetical protein